MHPEITPSSTSSSRPERGRDAIPVEQALAFQMALVEYVVGAPKWQEMTDGEKDVVMAKWFEQYASNEPRLGTGFNAFAEYCDEHADDTALIERLATGSWTEADLAALKAYAEDSDRGGAFIFEH